MKRIAGLDLLRGIAILLVMLLRHAVPDVFPGAGGVSPAFHGWTLATEEQFYLLWPALLAFAWVRGRVGAALVTVGLAALAACTATLFWLWPNADNAYALPTSWFACFVIGAAVRLKGRAAPRWAVPIALTGLAVLSVVPLAVTR